MAAFLAFLELRSYCEKYPSLTEAQALVSLSSVKSSSLGLDFRGGLVLRQALDPSVDWNSTPNCLRLFAFEWIRIVEPRWLRFVPFGRERVRRALDSDHAQCFREAGLFDETPNDEAIEWWDRVAALIRGLSDIEKMKRARLAERLSFEHERRRIKDLGICQQPKWVSLEDNSLGYDILSYDRNAEGRIVARLVEVKSKLSDSIFLTRNEWESAFGAAQRTVIHVWDLPMERLQEYHPKEIEASIPLDQGGGVWQNVRINVSSGL
ncbi:MAG: DUF3883 domain-containing protein [Nitrospinae bacterium]|nr:DUF3883 domain-containing protein [Nitrospinota bacterium]